MAHLFCSIVESVTDVILKLIKSQKECQRFFWCFHPMRVAVKCKTLYLQTFLPTKLTIIVAKCTHLLFLMTVIQDVERTKLKQIWYHHHHNNKHHLH